MSRKATKSRNCINGAAERVLDGAELGHDRRVAVSGHDRRFGNLQPAWEWPAEAPADEVLVQGERCHARRIGGLLIDRLPVEADDRGASGARLRFAHQRPRLKGACDIIQWAKLEDRELVFEGRQHLVGDTLRPIDRSPGDEVRALQDTVRPPSPRLSGSVASIGYLHRRWLCDTDVLVPVSIISPIGTDM